MTAPTVSPRPGHRHWPADTPNLVAVVVAVFAAALFAMPRYAPSPTMVPSVGGNVPRASVPAPPTGPPKVVLFGDSITDQAQATLRSRLDARYLVTVSAAGGTRSDQRERDVPALAAARPDEVVINLGTNDVVQARPVDQAAASLERIAAGFASARCIVIVTVSENILSFDDAGLVDRAAQLNGRIRTLAAAHGWRVLPWNDVVRSYESSRQSDGPLTTDSIHPTPMGQRMLADAYAAALGSC